MTFRSFFLYLRSTTTFLYLTQSIMKKILLFFLASLLALATSCSYDDSEIKDRLDDLDNKVAELEKLVKTLNSDVVSLRELVAGKRFISSVTTNEDGSYTLTLVTAGGETSTITIRNGNDGASPAIGVKLDTDGLYYWTLNGEYILANGKKLPVSGTDGTTPQFKIENDYWYVSYDNGTNWTECGKATYDSSIFKSVTVSEDGKQVYITLTDGTKLTFDLYTGFGITFGKASSQTLRVGETLAIPFTLTGADDKTLIETIPSGEWEVSVERKTTDTGFINVTAPDNSQTGKVVVLVNDGGTKTLMRTLTFVAGVLNVTTSSTEVPTGGGSVTAEVETDLEFTVSIPEDAGWITLPETRSEIRHETVTLNVAANTQSVQRQATVNLVSGGSVIETILIYQMAYYDPETMVLKVEADAALSNTIYLPIYGAVNATINWGDGNSEQIAETINTAAGMKFHTYAKPGNYYISIKGNVAQINNNLTKNANKPGIVEVIQWGQLGLTSLSNAFTGDTKLVQVAVPEQGAFTAVATADNMFYGCTALTTIPEGLFSDGGNITTIAYLFNKCTALESVPETLFANLSKVTTASSLFSSCTKLESVPATLFAQNTEITNLSSAFRATGLKSVPEELFKGLTAVTDMSALFQESTGLETIPANLFNDQTAVVGIGTMFKGCTGLSSIPETLFASLSEVANMSSLFSLCSSLENLPKDIFRNMSKVKSAGYLYEGCVRMTEFPNLKYCTSLTTVPAIWKDCKALVAAPADYFPESVSSSTSAAYMFSGCTALTSVPEDLFKDFTGTTIISEMFLNCTSLQSLPVGIFDNITKIKTASKTFSGCTAFTGESPYTEISVNNTPVKVHLYERAEYTDQFTAITSFTDCFKGCTKIADYSNIPIPWGGISDGTKTKPSIDLTIGLTPEQEYYAISISFKTTEVKSGNKWTIMTPKSLEEALEELGGDLQRVCTKYGVTYNITTANSSAGVALVPVTAEANTDYVVVVMGSNAHGTTFEQKTIKTAPYPKGEANYDRYLGTWKVTSTSSEINKTPQTFTIEITPYRVNESFRIMGWGITTLCDEFPLRMNYAAGNVTIASNVELGLYYPYYVYPMTRFYKPETNDYWLFSPSTPLISGLYDTEKNQIIIKGNKFTTEGSEYTISGLDYVLFSGGKYYEAANLLKPGYTLSDYSIGPYTLTKTSTAAPAKAPRIAEIQSGSKSKTAAASAPTGAFKPIRK